MTDKIGEELIEVSPIKLVDGDEVYLIMAELADVIANMQFKDGNFSRDGLKGNYQQSDNVVCISAMFDVNSKWFKDIVRERGKAYEETLPSDHIADVGKMVSIEDIERIIIDNTGSHHSLNWSGEGEATIIGASHILVGKAAKEIHNLITQQTNEVG